METINIPFAKGINNKARAESVPAGFLRSAINVIIDLAGNIRNRQGFTEIYTGSDIHSLWNRYFVEGGDLKYLQPDNTAKTIKTGVGSKAISFTSMAGRIYYSNGVVSGSIINGDYQGLGVKTPDYQPLLTARQGGDMFAGDYQVVITWLRNGEESGTGLASRITVQEGGGIVLSNFPNPPADVTHLAVYVSSVNGKEMYLYGEYDISIAVLEVFIEKHISTVPLATQFGNMPPPFKIVTGHYGRLYGAKDNYVLYSSAQNYGLFMPNNYWVFPDSVTGIISVPGAVYVGTATRIYRISNIDGEGMPVRTPVKEYGMTLSLDYAYDPDNEVAYVRSTKGDIAITNEGITEITATNLAMDDYRETVMVLIESDGEKLLIGISQGVESVSDLKASV